MKHADRVTVFLAFALCMIATTTFAQNVDFDAGMQGWSALMYGIGARIAVMCICSYLALWGLGHQHLFVSFCALLGALAYFGVGVVLGKIGIA